MKRMIKYGSIGQFRNIVTLMKRFDQPPKVTAQLTEKIHGTNASVCYSRPTGVWAQSKNNIITPENDNAGCAKFVHDREDFFEEFIESLAEDFDVDLDNQVITLYFEWCGGNIQKNSCVSGLSKRAILFNHFKVSEAEDIRDDAGGHVLNCQWHYLPAIYEEPSIGVYHVWNFTAWETEIDFDTPAIASQNLTDLVTKIENESPIGSAFNKKNIGEGVVGTFFIDGELYRFKAKGDKHSNSKVKKMVALDPIKEGKVVGFVNEVCKAWRFEQAWQSIFGIDNEKRDPSVEATGDFIRAVHKDIMKEENDILDEAGLVWKDVNARISKVARTWFMEQLDQYAGLG